MSRGFKIHQYRTLSELFPLAQTTFKAASYATISPPARRTLERQSAISSAASPLLNNRPNQDVFITRANPYPTRQCEALPTAPAP